MEAIRLELARTREFPNGSSAHAFLVHLPLDDAGHIDAKALETSPAKAAVRRAWAGQREMSGYVIPTATGWAFSYRPGEEDDELIYHLENHAIGVGQYVTLTEPDGSVLPFRVTSVMDPA